MQFSLPGNLFLAIMNASLLPARDSDFGKLAVGGLVLLATLTLVNAARNWLKVSQEQLVSS